jgi:hypothetical protein
MSFRRRRDEWDDFLKRHGHAVRECGIPDEIAANKMRFLIFLDHGYDQWGWGENHHAFFDSRFLTEEQIARLADLVAMYIDDRYRVPISSRWQRAW